MTISTAVGVACVSADSHITEPHDAYDQIDPAFADRKPFLHRHETMGDIYVIPGLANPVPMGLVAAAGKPAEQITIGGVLFDELHRGGWDPLARAAEQDRDGVVGEILYPSVGMVLCSHPDLEYRQACMRAYNRWIAGYCSADPQRLYGIGQSAMVSPEDGIADLHLIKELGLYGVMMPGIPGMEDYDSPIYDRFYETAIELELPLTFHILTGPYEKYRGPRLNSFLSIVRQCQDVVGALIFGAVFERHPDLKVVCAEADAGWVPHYLYRMDHAFSRHRNWMSHGDISMAPSEYFRRNVWVTFQDDWIAFASVDLMDESRLMWANDFPHSDSTWPWSQEMLAEHTAALSDHQRQRILRDNCIDLYGLPV